MLRLIYMCMCTSTPSRRLSLTSDRYGDGRSFFALIVFLIWFGIDRRQTVGWDFREMELRGSLAGVQIGVVCHWLVKMCAC